MTPRNDRPQVLETLRSEILDGTLEPGAALREVALASRFEVSRTPVRDALSRLEQAGLVVRSGRALVVQGTDPQTVVQICDARTLLEEQIAGDAALHRTVQDVLRLEALLERDRTLEEPDLEDGRLLARCDLEFHQALWAASHNPVLTELLETLTQRPVDTRRSTLSSSGRWEQALDEHAQMLRVVSDRDDAAARAIARAHSETDRTLRMDILREDVASMTTGDAR